MAAAGTAVSSGLGAAASLLSSAAAGATFSGATPGDEAPGGAASGSAASATSPSSGDPSRGRRTRPKRKVINFLEFLIFRFFENCFGRKNFYF